MDYIIGSFTCQKRLVYFYSAQKNKKIRGLLLMDLGRKIFTQRAPQAQVRTFRFLSSLCSCNINPSQDFLVAVIIILQLPWKLVILQHLQRCYHNSLSQESFSEALKLKLTSWQSHKLIKYKWIGNSPGKQKLQFI